MLTRVLIRHLWQLETVVFLHWCLIRVILFEGESISKIKISKSFQIAVRRGGDGTYRTSTCVMGCVFFPDPAELPRPQLGRQTRTPGSGDHAIKHSPRH